MPEKTEKLLARDVEQEQAGIFLVSVQSLPQNCVLLLSHILLIDLICMSVLLQSFVCIFAQIEHVC